MQAYSEPKRASDPYSLPDVEVFEVTGQQEYAQYAAGEDGIVEAGWYWQSCLPGCLPDSDPFGPFATREEALADAQSEADDCADDCKSDACTNGVCEDCADTDGNCCDCNCHGA